MREAGKRRARGYFRVARGGAFYPSPLTPTYKGWPGPISKLKKASGAISMGYFLQSCSLGLVPIAILQIGEGRHQGSERVIYLKPPR